MSDTPETEAVIADMNSNIYDHAMKLERERDKWRGIAEELARFHSIRHTRECLCVDCENGREALNRYKENCK